MTMPKPQLLIVDDYTTNIKVLSSLLSGYGFEVLIARDGEDALQKLQRIQPDLILLDILMPGIDGFETCRRIKGQKHTRDIPVIFMSALTDPVDKVKGLTLGAVDYITKPFQQEEVLARVNTHLRLRSLTKQLEEQNAQLQEEIRSRQLAELALRSSEEKFSIAFRANPCATMIISLAEGRILEINQMFCDSFKYFPETILNRPLKELQLFARLTDLQRFLDSLQATSAVRNQEYQLLTAVGDPYWFLISAETIQIRDAPCSLVMMSDITTSKQTTAELQQARAAAELANQAKTQFLANISHELRTPLNTILGYIQLMERDRTLNRDQRDHLHIINRSSQHLLTLINDVLEMTRIESGRLVLNETPFQLSHLLEAIYSILEPKVSAKGLQLTFELSPAIPTYIRADETKLRQVLINLVGNAVKFTERGQVQLRVGLGKRDGNGAAPSAPLSLTFKVADTGPGIAEDELDTLFDPFIQTETGRRTQEGTGLGLPISQRFVQFMGGAIEVESTVGQGSLFGFTIPVSPATAADIGPAVPQQRVIGLRDDQPAYRILIVEDQVANRRLLTKLLSMVGFAVQEATNGEEAIHIHRHWQPHLIFMDMRMPVMDGLEATRQIKRQQAAEGAPTKIIALTAQAFEEERQAVFAAGCDGFVRKPIHEAALFGTIAENLGVTYIYQGDDPSEASDIATQDIAPQPRIGVSTLENLTDLTGGDREFLLEYLHLHLHQLPELMQTLRHSLDRGDAAEVSLTAHTLKGLALSFEANSVIQLCLRIEQAAAADNLAAAAATMAELKGALAQLITAIETTLEELSTPQI